MTISIPQPLAADEQPPTRPLPPASWRPCPAWCTTDHGDELCPDWARMHMAHVGTCPDGTTVTVVWTEHRTEALRARCGSGPRVMVVAPRASAAGVFLAPDAARVLAASSRCRVSAGLLVDAAELAGVAL